MEQKIQNNSYYQIKIQVFRKLIVKEEIYITNAIEGIKKNYIL